MFKGSFHLPSGGPYLLAHSVGCLPVGVRERMERDFLSTWQSKAGDGWGDWLDQVHAFRVALAGLLGGSAEEWCPRPSVSGGIAQFLSGIRFAPERQVILASKEAFPSVGFALSGLERIGLRLELIDGNPTLPSSWSRIADPDVAAVVAMHVHSNSGRVSPIESIVADARAHGVVTVVDIAQSAGVLPIDVARWNADAVAGTALKWLCGGPGACFLWVSPDITGRVEPLERGWFSHADPFEMDIGRFRFAPDARRFWGGTPNIAPFVAAQEGLRLIGEIGVDHIRAHNLQLVHYLMELAPGLFSDSTPPEERGGTVCLPLGKEAEANLSSGGVRCDRRGEMLRLSFAIWNDEADVEIVAAHIN